MTNYTIYRLFDYETGLYVGKEFSSIIEFFEHHYDNTFPTFHWCHGLIEYLKPVHRIDTGRRWGPLEVPPRRPGMFQNRYSIKNEYGINFEHPEELYKVASKYGLNLFKPWSWNSNWDADDEPLVFPPKNNVNKMKPEVWSWYYRGVRTANEHRQNDGHIHEYEEEYEQRFVRGRRRGYNLPSSWDDKPNSLWDTRKNWKHNSKRRHQWKPK